MVKMSWQNWFRRRSLLFPSLFFTSIVLGVLPWHNQSVVVADEAGIGIETLPFCDDEIGGGQDAKNTQKGDRHLAKRLIYVTTLDGHIAALDLANGGETHWDVATGPGELLSSSIQNLELTNNGQVVRIIPSLSGSLYQLTGRTVEAIPITAENLLSLSYKFSDDLVISGGKDTRSYGVSAKTGKVIYECTMAGCKNESMANGQERNKIFDEGNGDKDKSTDTVDLSDHDYYVDDVVVVRRQTQTVRAIDPRTGIERWNFSVGNHELEILSRDDCHQQHQGGVDLSDIDLRVVVPEGIICAYSKSTATLLWQKQFQFPIVNAWRYNGDGKLGKVDLFSSVQWMYDTESTPNFSTTRKINPSIYVGLFNKQLYVQESESMRRRYQEYLTNQSKDMLAGADMPIKTLSLPWKPVPAIKTDQMALEMEHDDYSEKDLLDKFALMTISNPKTTWEVSKGFYIIDEATTPIKCPQGNETKGGKHNHSLNTDSEESNLVTLVSMWYWWKEILVISLTSALVVNLFLNNSARLKHELVIQGTQPEKESVIVERYIEIPIPVEKTATASGSDQSKGSSALSILPSGANFSSRFLSDFDMIQCLGKGGFGVVFEAKNKLDDCRYAVKRIVLPGKKENRDRVMREVKTLANCEHQNIVRFFQAWVEQPPPGWQEDQDQFWLSHQDSIMSTSIDIDTAEMSKGIHSYNNTTTGGIYNERLPVSPRRGIFAELNTDECLNLDEEKARKTSFQASDIWSRGKQKKRQSSGKAALALEEEDDCSFIEFRYSTNNNNDDDIELDDNILQNEDESSEDEDEEEEEEDSGTGANYCPEDTDSVFKHSSSEEAANGSNGLKKSRHRRNFSLDVSPKEAAAAVSNRDPRSRMYLYIQMQLCQKQSLKEWLQLTSKAERMLKIVPIFDQITRAVEYVHLKGLIHRDLKPSNIFFALDGTVKVGDFGLVTDMEECPDEEALEALEGYAGGVKGGDGKWISGSGSGGVFAKKHTQQVGTHLYMSPEQLEGRAYDYKVDIYSLGLILFELLVVFSTEMERIKALTSLRQNNYPLEYLPSYEGEMDLLKLMLSKKPHERPTTFGIRARPPLNQLDPKGDYHFELPSRRKDSRTTTNSITESN